MTVTWTSGYDISDATPFVEWGLEGEAQTRSPAGTLTFSRNSMCGMISSCNSSARLHLSLQLNIILQQKKKKNTSCQSKHLRHFFKP